MDRIIELRAHLQQLSEHAARVQTQLWQLMAACEAFDTRTSPTTAQKPAAQSRKQEPQRAPQQEASTLYVDTRACRGCGICINIAPFTFRMDPQTRRVVAISPPGDPPAAIQMAIARCPMRAIHYRQQSST